jgi:hypothetical protein
MRNPSLGCMAMAIVLIHVPADEVGAVENKRSNSIKVVEATYGGNCEGVTAGNVTPFVASMCDSKDLCNFRVYYKKMGGDPAEGCEKNFAVTYTCGRSAKRNACTLAPEAGKGGEEGHANHFCLLHCLATSNSPIGRPSAAVAGADLDTDGSNSREAQTPRPPTSRNGRTYRTEPYGRRFDQSWW